MAFSKFGSRRPSQQQRGKTGNNKYQRLTGLFPVRGKHGQYFGVVGAEYADQLLENLDRIRQDGQTIGLTFFINDDGPCGLTYTAVDVEDRQQKPTQRPQGGRPQAPRSQKPYTPRAQTPVNEPVIPEEVDDTDYQVEDYGN